MRVSGVAGGGRLIVNVCVCVCTCFDCKMTRHTHYIHILLIYICIYTDLHAYIYAYVHPHTHTHTCLYTDEHAMPWQNVYTKNNALTFGILIFLPIFLHMDYLPLFRSLRRRREYPRCYN